MCQYRDVICGMCRVVVSAETVTMATDWQGGRQASRHIHTQIGEKERYLDELHLDVLPYSQHTQHSSPLA